MIITQPLTLAQLADLESCATRAHYAADAQRSRGGSKVGEINEGNTIVQRRAIGSNAG
jgi:hypothetical protein